ncbi:MAG TPA: S41 family peptidase [Gemmataceae bacterium]|jgi:tricorn protease|nr:S41 family peptidase [Gemmataceae bacterium]
MISRISIALFGLLCLTSASQAQEPISFARSPDISPDGRQVVFSYKGDVWIVDAIGGVARPITMHEAHDTAPCLSPDGRSIAFSSNRHGSYDVFVVSVLGGQPKRLTFDSGSEAVSGWTPDGKAVIYSSNRGDEFPARPDLYKIDVTGGREQRITTTEARQGVMSPDGAKIAYVRGPGFSFRKGYRGSANDDVWVSNADGSAPSRLTDFNGEDTSPMWGPDSRTIYYVSECLGNPANIVRQRLDGPGKPERITDHKTDGVRLARISRDGNWIVYECGADLWITPTSGGPARKLAIEVHADDKENNEHVLTLTQGISEYAMSADERTVAFTIMGELFLAPTTGGKATRLTDRAANDHAPVWSPDGRKLVFSSDVGGFEDLYLLEPDDPDHSQLSRARKFKYRRLTFTPEAEIGASFSPDGRKIAFLRGGQLWTMDPDGSGAKVLVKEASVFDYDWSPDGRNLVFARRDASFASDLYIIPASGGEARNITRYGTMHEDVSWSRRGGKIAFISERRRNEPSMFVLSLQKPSPPDAMPGSDIDWDDIHLRVTQPASLHIDEGAISSDGTRVAFRASSHNGDDLWVAAADGSSLVRLTNSNLHPQQIHWSRLVPDLIFFRDRTGQIRFMRAGAPNQPEPRLAAAAEPGKIPITAKLRVRRDEQFLEMFDQSCRILSESFYDPKFGGLDWQAIRAKYRPLVKQVTMREDFYYLVNLMFGELNVSHVALQGPTRMDAEEQTAELGLLFDPAFPGPGLRIREILKRGPADRRGIALSSGDIVTAIDGKVLDNSVNLAQQLNGKAKETVVLEVASKGADPGLRRHVEIEPIARTALADLMYNRWVDQNAAKVNQLSKGRLGYIHIKSMDEDSLEHFVRSLYADNFDKQGLVLDVRFNAGGFTHDQVLSYLGGRDHTIFHRRDGAQGMVMRSFDRKWTKPIVLLINNRSYSDAEILPSAFRVLGLGKLVGEPTGGHVLGMTAARLIDGSRLNIPQIGVTTNNGVNLEMSGVQPDFLIEAKPDQMARGIDAQIAKAVEVLDAEVVAKQAAAAKVAQQINGGAKPSAAPAGSAIK